MSKTMMWVVGAIVAILIALGLWFAMKSSSSPSAEGSPAPQAGAATSGSLASLVARGGTVQCDVNHTTGNDTMTGTVFVSGQKVRGDFESTVPQVGAVQSHMISEGEYVYVWSSAMPSGMKMKASATSQTSGPASQASAMYTQNYDYNCTPWSSDASKFELPVGITFNDMSAMMPTGAAASGSAAGSVKMPSGANCAMCDQAPDATSKAQCKAALGCK